MFVYLFKHFVKYNLADSLRSGIILNHQAHYCTEFNNPTFGFVGTMFLVILNVIIDLALFLTGL